MDMKKTEKALFAGGCFWHVQLAFSRLPGVVSTTAGYTGGRKKDPTYEEVCTGGTGHVEAVLVEYDPEEVSYETLLDLFWRIHDPTTADRQGPDVGSQYRPVIFYFTEEQKRKALESKRRLDRSGLLDGPVVTAIEEAGDFYPAEEYHQRYFEKRGR